MNVYLEFSSTKTKMFSIEAPILESISKPELVLRRITLNDLPQYLEFYAGTREQLSELIQNTKDEELSEDFVNFG